MNITRASDYAFRALLYLAKNGHVPAETAKVAKEIDVPPIYLRKIFQSLARAGFVRTSPGSGGGVMLAVSPENITFKDVIEALDGRVGLSECIDNPEACRRSDVCKVRLSLADVQLRLEKELAARRLSDMLD